MSIELQKIIILIGIGIWDIVSIFAAYMMWSLIWIERNMVDFRAPIRHFVLGWLAIVSGIPAFYATYIIFNMWVNSCDIFYGCNP